MALSAGTRLGPYEIRAAIGAGGMGEVYRASDTKLGRDVALKILPELFAADADRLSRFQREAKVLASLNHPNIAQIYGFEDSGATHALVLELVDGPTLADRIAQGPIPLAEALALARQIADALEAAHEQGIVHRDLKPANIKVREDGTVKVLDFGLAKVTSLDMAHPELTQAPTLTALGTHAGVILGTAAYMSPEQARGQAVDKRSDVWAFGCVLFEMATGRAPFARETVTDTIGAILEREPDWGGLPGAQSTGLRLLLQRCLAKDPRRRLRDVGDIRLFLDDIGSDQPLRAASLVLIWGIVAVLAVALVLALWAPWRGAVAPAASSMRFNVDLGPEAIGGRNLGVVISPDGTRLAFAAHAPDGNVRLATRLLDEFRLTFLEGTEGAADPFFSPDGQWIGFITGGQMKKVPVHGGIAVHICDSGAGLFGESWGDDQSIVFAPGATTPLFRVSSGGGQPQQLTRVGAQGDATNRWPQVLPGGKAVLFTSHKIVAGFDDANIDVVVVATGMRKTVLRGGYFGRYVHTNGAGYLLFVREGVLFEVPFDLEKLDARGTPAPVTDGIAGDSDTAAGQFDVARTGTLIYRSGTGPSRKWPVLWLDSSGRATPLVAEPAAYYTPKFSPTGTQLALMVDHGEKGRDLAVYDWSRGVMTRLTFTDDVHLFPVWSPDGKYIVFETSSAKGYGIGVVRADGTGKVQLLGEHDGLMIPTSFSPDGKRLAYYQQERPSGFQTFTATFDASDRDHVRLGTPDPLLIGPYAQYNVAFSTDGRWIAYTSNESGRLELYVRPFGRPGGKVQISKDGGNVPFWGPTGRELFFKAQNLIMVAEYTIRGDAFVAGTPHAWSQTPIGLTVFGRDLALSPDGKRFAVFPPRDSPAGGPLRVAFVLNFFDEIRQLGRASQQLTVESPTLVPPT
jgi:serine/threonine-protein kinase